MCVYISVEHILRPTTTFHMQLHTTHEYRPDAGGRCLVPAAHDTAPATHRQPACMQQSLKQYI